MRLLLCVSVSVLLLGRSGARAEQCRKGWVRCGDSDQCVPESWLCNGLPTCSNGWDQLHCTSCKKGSFLCDGSRCVINGHKCDGLLWCLDGADEANCAYMKLWQVCGASSRCNGVYGDCWTMHDEIGCTPEMCRAPADSSTYCDGRCLKASSWCDGIADCSDGQDEVRCPGTLSPALGSSWR